MQTAFEECRENTKESGAEDEAAAAKMAIAGVGAFFHSYSQERTARAKPRKGFRAGPCEGGAAGRPA
eukprot:5336835-Alexandrium_andersonii.AAC.1